MQHPTQWLILLFCLSSAQGDAMVQTRDTTRLPNCYQKTFVTRLVKHSLRVKHIPYRLASIKLVAVTKTRYKEFPEAYYCQGIIEYTQHTQRIRNVFVYHISWMDTFAQKVQVRSTLYPFNPITRPQ